MSKKVSVPSRGLPFLNDDVGLGYAKGNSFRPLSGSSFSKLDLMIAEWLLFLSFRPLSGASFSKYEVLCDIRQRDYQFPSPLGVFLF